MSRVLRRVGADSVWSCPEEMQCPCSPCTGMSLELSTILDSELLGTVCFVPDKRDMADSCELLCLICQQPKRSAGSAVCLCLPSLTALRFCAGKSSGQVLPSLAPRGARGKLGPVS